MSRKQLLRPYRVLEDQDISIDFQSEKTITQLCDVIQYDITWAGAGISGELAVEFSNDDGETWTPLIFATNPYIPLSGASGIETIIIKEQVFQAVRLNYNAIAGTGTIDAIVSAKSIGA
jgi:hypothetical protein